MQVTLIRCYLWQHEYGHGPLLYRKKSQVKPVFHQANLFIRTEKKSNLIDWQQTLTTSPANHIRFLLVCVEKITKWNVGLKSYPVFVLDSSDILIMVQCSAVIVWITYLSVKLVVMGD